jgi:hypothetical protein
VISLIRAECGSCKEAQILPIGSGYFIERRSRFSILIGEPDESRVSWANWHSSVVPVFPSVATCADPTARPLRQLRIALMLKDHRGEQ